MIELLNIPGAYFNALLVCFFVVYFREYGFILNPLRALKSLKAFWPVLKASLFGFIPAVLVLIVAQRLAPNLSNTYQRAIPALGIFISAVLLHKHLLPQFKNRIFFNISVAVLIALQVALIATLF